MSAQLTVAIAGHGPDALLQRAILATLPNDFRLVDAGADIMLLSGRDGDADALLAFVPSSTRAIMLVSPASTSAATRAPLVNLERDAGVPVVIGLGYAPWFVADGLAWDAAHEEEVAIVELTAAVTNISAARDALLEQLHIGRTMMGPLRDPTVLLDSAMAKVVEVEGGSPPIKWRMTACHGLAEQLIVERIARTRRSKVVIARDSHARPPHISHHDAQGSHLATPVYQSGYRAGWIALHAALTANGVPSGALDQLQADMALLGWGD